MATALEVTQGIQDLENRIPLVEDRLTAVRLYGRVDDGLAAADVKGALGAWRGNQFLGIAYPENDAVTLHDNGGERINIDDSLYFYVPLGWRFGTVKLKGVIYQSQPSSMDFEPNEDNNYVEVTVTFEPVDPLYVRLVPEHIHSNYNAANQETTFYYFGNEETVDYVMRDLYRYLPISELVYDASMNFPISIPAEFGGGDVVVNGPVFPALHAAQGVEWDFRPYQNGAGKFGEWPEANAAMSVLRLWSPSPVNSWYWYGMVDSAMDTGSWTGLATNGVSSGKFGTSFESASPWHLRYGTTVVHELGHKILPGSDHINCAGTESGGGSLDEEYPYPEPDCSMAAIDPAGFYGFDVYWAMWPELLDGPTVISNDPAAPQPNRGFPYMSYSKPKWADPYDYCKSLAGLGIECDKAMVYFRPGPVRLVSKDPADARSHPQSPGGPGAPMLAGQAAGPYSLISGSVKLEGEAGGSIDRYVPTDAAPAGSVFESGRRLAEMSAANTDGPAIVFLGPSANVLATYPLRNLDGAPHEDAAESFDTLEFAEWFPLPVGVTAVELRQATRTLDRRSASQNPPAVKLTSPNGGAVDAPLKVEWEASDADGDSLLFTVLYSADGGANWHAVVSDIPGRTVTFRELGTIGGSSRGLFKVIVSDGFLSAEDISDAAIKVPDRPPLASILTPGKGGRFPQNATVTFAGMAFDVEEYGLPPSGLTWESNLDGSLGVGTEIMTRTLQPGTHVITLRAKDGAGNEGFATVEVIIEASERKLAAAEEERDLVRLLGGTPSDEDSKTLWFIVGGAVAGVIAGIGGAALWRRRSKSGAP